MTSYRDLQVWQYAVEFSVLIYQLTDKFPKKEQYSLSNQLNRAAVSIASNIAEGYQRQTRKEFIQFLYISYGSCAEVETQLLIAKKLEFVSSDDYTGTLEKLQVIEKMLNSLTRKLKSSQTSNL